MFWGLSCFSIPSSWALQWFFVFFCSVLTRLSPVFCDGGFKAASLDSRQERSENTTQGYEKTVSVWTRVVNELESVYMLCVSVKDVWMECVYEWMNNRERGREREHKHIAPEGNSSLPRSLHLFLSLSLYLAPHLSSILSLCRFLQPLSLSFFSPCWLICVSSPFLMNSFFTLSPNVIFFLLISHVQNSLFQFQLCFSVQGLWNVFAPENPQNHE